MDEALRVLDMFFESSPDIAEVELATYAALAIGKIVQTLTERETQSDLLQSIDSASRPGTMIQAVEWAMEAFVWHKPFLPDAIPMSHQFAKGALETSG